MRILIIDDEEMVLESIKHELAIEGFNEITTLANGLKAATYLQTKKPDLIISDIAMPHLSGLELLSLLKNVWWCNVPVILISSLSGELIVERAFELGAYDFVAKPINYTELSLRVRKIWIQHQERMQSN